MPRPHEYMPDLMSNGPVYVENIIVLYKGGFLVPGGKAFPVRLL